MTNKKAIKHIKDKIKHIDSCDNSLSVFQYALTLVMDLYGQHVPPSDILSIEKDFIDKGIIPAKDKRKNFFSEYKGSQKHKDYICRILYFIRYIKLGKCSSAYDKLSKEDKNDYLVRDIHYQLAGYAAQALKADVLLQQLYHCVAPVIAGHSVPYEQVKGSGYHGHNDACKHAASHNGKGIHPFPFI